MSHHAPRRRIPSYLSCLVLLLGAAGCATVPMAAKEHDDAAKTFTTQPDVTNLYVYRASTFGFAVKFPIAVDGRLLGELPGSTYIFVTVPPGAHTLLVSAETNKTLEFTTEAGKNVYIKVTPAMGFLSANANLYLMADEEEARQDVRGCALILVPR